LMQAGVGTTASLAGGIAGGGIAGGGIAFSSHRFH
jgi:hypothetical protein